MRELGIWTRAIDTFIVVVARGRDVIESELDLGIKDVGGAQRL
jgi:hypothetical protein